GSELATFFSGIGTRVVLLQSAPMILNREDQEIAQMAHETLAARGVEVIGSSKIVEIVDARGGVYGVRVEAGGEESMHAVDWVLVAAGKRSNVDGLALDKSG